MDHSLLPACMLNARAVDRAHIVPAIKVIEDQFALGEGLGDHTTNSALHEDRTEGCNDGEIKCLSSGKPTVVVRVEPSPHPKDTEFLVRWEFDPEQDFAG